MFTSVGKKQTIAAIVIFGSKPVAHDQHENRRLRDDRDRVEHHGDRIEDVLQRLVVHEDRRKQDRREIAEQEAAAASMAVGRGSAAARRSC